MNNAPETTPRGPLTRLEEREAEMTALLMWGNPVLVSVAADLIRKRWIGHPWANRKTMHLRDSSDLSGL
jgi:hypothetical protein